MAFPLPRASWMMGLFVVILLSTALPGGSAAQYFIEILTVWRKSLSQARPP